MKSGGLKEADFSTNDTEIKSKTRFMVLHKKHVFLLPRKKCVARETALPYFRGAF